MASREVIQYEGWPSKVFKWFSVVFIAFTQVDWAVVAIIAVGSTIGGQIGARVGRRLDPRLLRALIVLVGTTALVRLL